MSTNLYNPHPETRETARRATGSYYTPRYIVDYMVDEALLEVLAENSSPSDDDPAFWRERLRYLLDYEDAFDDAGELFDRHEAEAVVRAVANLRVLDPAVGSGAFPMGVLHKLTLVLRRLDPDNTLWEELQKAHASARAGAAFDEIEHTFEIYRESDFGRKLYLIQNGLYGVDIQPIACQITKLRFFISLIVEQKVNSNPLDNYGIRPLPNLETRFVAADALLRIKNEQGNLTSQTAINHYRKLEENRIRYFHANTAKQKYECKQEDLILRRSLFRELQAFSGIPSDDAHTVAIWDPFDQNASARWFDPEYMFGVTDKFDIVIGNPPYVKVEHLDDLRRSELKRSFGWLGDLYEHFIFRGTEILSEDGVFSYIANDSYLTLTSKKRVRELFLKNTLLQLTKAPSQTFDASIYAAIFVLRKRNPKNDHTYNRGFIKPPNFDYVPLDPISYRIVHAVPDKKFLLSEDNDIFLKLLNKHDDNIASFCQVLDTGIHSGNVRKKIFFLKKNPNLDRLLQGIQIQRYKIYWDNPRARYKFCDIGYECRPVPGIGRGGKPSKRDEYWQFCGNIENHHQPERLLIRQTDDDLVVAYHNEEEHGRFYTDNTLFTVLPKVPTLNLKFFLALLNSRLFNFLYHCLSQEKGKSQAQVKIKNINLLPVILPSVEVQVTIIEIVDKILTGKSQDNLFNSTYLMSEIDQIIYQIYDLTQDEIDEVEKH